MENKKFDEHQLNNRLTSYPTISSELEEQLKYRAGKCDDPKSDTTDEAESTMLNKTESFIDFMITKFTHEDNKAIKNRNLYFHSELAVLVLTASATVFNLICAYTKDSIAGDWFGVLATAATASVTVILGYRSIKGYMEAWLRHRNYVQQFQEVCHSYAYGCGKYGYYEGAPVLKRDSQEAIDYEEAMYNKFKNDVSVLIKDRHTEFKENMSRRSS
ncbi:MAG: DUF4231 domain-containing protein [Clostridia bacterium]|nr:DUF4231 domain-containing protein [Clostridia bacterium]